MDDISRWMRRPVSRRQLLRGAGRGGLGLAAGAFLAACSSGAGPKPGGSSTGLPPLAHEVDVAQWPLYIDRAKGGHRPTLEAFEKETGIAVDYREIINDNQAFFSKLAPQLEAGQPTGWDVIALSDWVVTLMNQKGWLRSLDFSLLPNVTAHLGDSFRDPAYDPGNAHSVPWQGGITGIAYNTELAPFAPTMFADLWDERLVGHVGMLTEMVDTMTLTLLSLGIDPQGATIDDATKAQERLLEQRAAGIVRNYYGQDYVNALSRGDTWVTMAWSGDIYYLQLDQPELRFAVPEEGGVLWVTPLEIPVGAAHPTDAHAFMDWFYRPDVAAAVTEWVGYITPVPEVREIILRDAKQQHDDYLRHLATSPLVFPTTEMLTKLHQYKAFSPEERQTYEELFSQVLNG